MSLSLLTVLGDTVASYRVSEFIPGAVALRSFRSSPSIGRSVDEVENGPGPTSEVMEISSSASGAMAPPSLSAGEREGEPLAIFDPVDHIVVEDRRLFHPELSLMNASKTVRGSNTRLDASSLPQMAHLVKYRVSSKFVITCIRRRIRRSVILAKGHGGANVYRPPQSMEICE